MATKIIKAWIDGAVQEIEVEDIVSPEMEPSVEERVDKLEDKHEVIITDGNFLVGNGTENMVEKTPAEVLSHINGANVTTMTTAEYEALTPEESNANTLYLLTDEEDPEYVLQSDFEALQTEVDEKSQVQVITAESSNILPTLKIHRLTQEEYEQEVANGTLSEDTLYLTPEEKIDLSGYATIEQVNAKADSTHNHDDRYYTESEVNDLISNHNHDSSYDTNGSANAALETANAYTDSAIAQKTQVQIITWEDDD